MDEEKMISDMRKVLLDYCITDLRSNDAARNGHKDDYTVLDYGKYVGAKTLAITVLEHIPEYCQDDKKKMKEFLFGVHEEATSKASVGDYIITGVHGEQHPCKPVFSKKRMNP